MNNLLVKLLGMLAAIGGILALFFRGNAYKAKAEAQQQRAATAEAVNDTHRRVDESRAQVGKKHRQERQQIDQEIDAGRRDHLDNNG